MKIEITQKFKSSAPVVGRLAKKPLNLPPNRGKRFWNRAGLFLIVMAAVLATTFVGGVGAQDGPIGQQRQELVGGTLVSLEDQEKYGLVTVNNSCSGSLLRNNWIITAAHCVDDPDPEHPGKFITVPDDSVTLTANWASDRQVRRSARIITFRPMDVAIIRVSEPFIGPRGGFNRGVYQGNPVPVSLTAYGRGINQFAQGSGATATPAQRDGLYRMASFTTDRQEGEGADHLVWYPSANGAMIAGGDSGGPSYVSDRSGTLLFGVHSRARSTCLPSRPMGANCDGNNWNWISSTSQAADAPIAPIWDDVRRYIGVYLSPTTLVSNDFNNNGLGDVLWHNASTGETQIWFMRASSRVGRATVLGEDDKPTFVGLPWSIVGSNDFNSDGKPDVLWHNAATGETQQWLMDGYRLSGRRTVLGEDGKPAFVGLPWRIVGTNDFNGDGKTDILWHNAATGETQQWLLDGYRLTGRRTVLGEDGKPAFVGLPWSIVSTNDFNYDGKADVLWHNAATGETQQWLMDGYRVSGRATVLGENGKPAFVGLPWRIVGTNDFNQDLRADILWHNAATGETQIWFMSANWRTVLRRATVDAARDGGGALVGAPWSIMNH